MTVLFDANGNKISRFLNNRQLSTTMKMWCKNWLKDIKRQEDIFDALMPSRILDQYGKRFERQNKEEKNDRTNSD